MAKSSLRLSCVAALLALATLAAPIPAQAVTQLSLGGSTSGQFDFIGTGSNTVFVSTAGLTGQGFFTGDVTLGTYSLGALPNLLWGPEVAGHFTAPAGTTETFTYTNAGESLTGLITWSFIQDNTANPRFFGTLLVQSVGGTNAAFLSAFTVGSIANIDLTTTTLMALIAGKPMAVGTLDQVAASEGLHAFAGVSSGEVLPTPSAVPLPGALPMFAGGLIGLWALGKKRKKQKAVA